MKKQVEFKTLSAGELFTTPAGNEFVKVNENGAKRIEDHWASSEKFWPFSEISKVLVAE